MESIRKRFGQYSFSNLCEIGIIVFYFEIKGIMGQRPYLTVASSCENRQKDWKAALEVMLGQRRPFTRDD